ncbi:MAG: 50S ribosomal protein L15 [Patescibacteria group bacterium]|nr:50S ribosomal protein L15 [Patescibacteria group bacterium]MDD5567188.1 50S ribosomal protein L15 [Patescibacteria group bacterium]
MGLHNLKPNSRKNRKRVGRGNASGHGTYSTRGLKGQKSRTGGSIPPGFEGGRTPIIRQTPKSRGFRSHHLKPEIVNLKDLQAAFSNKEQVTPEKLVAKGLIQKVNSQIKILGEGKLEKSLVIIADAFSKSAKDAIKKAGGETKFRLK